MTGRPHLAGPVAKRAARNGNLVTTGLWPVELRVDNRESAPEVGNLLIELGDQGEHRVGSSLRRWASRAQCSLRRRKRRASSRGRVPLVPPTLPFSPAAPRAEPASPPPPSPATDRLLASPSQRQRRSAPRLCPGRTGRLSQRQRIVIRRGPRPEPEGPSSQLAQALPQPLAERRRTPSRASTGPMKTRMYKAKTTPVAAMQMSAMIRKDTSPRPTPSLRDLPPRGAPDLSRLPKESPPWT